MATHLYNPYEPKKVSKAKRTSAPKKTVKAAKTTKAAKAAKAAKAVGGFNLTPLISALLLAGIKLSLEQNKKNGTNGTKSNKDKKITDARKSSKPKRRPRTV